MATLTANTAKITISVISTSVPRPRDMAHHQENSARHVTRVVSPERHARDGVMIELELAGTDRRPIFQHC